MSVLQGDDTILIPEPNTTDLLFKEKRTRFSITGCAALTFLLRFRAPNSALRRCVEAFNSTIQLQNSRVTVGMNNTVIVVVHVDDLCDSVPIVSTDKYPDKNSCDQMYDKIRAAGELVDNIYNCLLHLYETSEYYEDY